MVDPKLGFSFILLIYLLYPTLVFDTFQSSRKSWRKMAFLLSPSVLGLAAVAGLVIYLFFFSKPKLPPGTKKLPGPKGSSLLPSVLIQIITASQESHFSVQSRISRQNTRGCSSMLGPSSTVQYVKSSSVQIHVF